MLLFTLLFSDAFSFLPFDLFRIEQAHAAASLTQTHYHWRNNDGSETLATSMTSGSEDAALAEIGQNESVRLRMGVSNEGTQTSSSTAFVLEYGTKITTCDTVVSWVTVGSPQAAWSMHDSAYITDGDNTTNISVPAGGITDENTTFIASNAALKDTSATVATTTLASTEFLETEFSIKQTATAAFGATYCFRLSSNGTPLDAYDSYPELATAAERDFVVQRGTAVVSGTSYTITAGIDYTAPASTSSAFIRITNSHHTGAGKTVAGGTQPADDVTVSISDPGNLQTSVTFTRSATALNNSLVSWEIVEFVGIPGSDNEIVVHDQRTVTYGTASLIATGTALSAIADDSDIVVFITGQQNPDTTSSDYNTGMSIARWAASTNEPVFSRGEANGDAVIVSYAVVEFTGASWKVQRSEHVYTAAGVTETESIAPLNSLTRTFIHTQKSIGIGLLGTDEFGHQVWLSSIGAVSYLLQSGANTPSDHISVAWIIENTQTTSGAMTVTRSDGSSSGGAEPLSLSLPIGKTLDDITNASVFANTSGEGIGSTYPRPIASFSISSTTHYELWRSDTGTVINYRTEIVEWPTARLTLSMNDYRFFADNGQLLPTDPWPAGGVDLGENTVITETDSPLSDFDRIRIRTSLLVENTSFPRHSKSFKLQYAERITTCSAVQQISWNDVGSPGSGAIWRGYDSPSVADEAVLSTDPAAGGDLVLAVSDTAGTYEESNSSAINPYSVEVGDDVEYDWLIEQNGAPAGTFFCFRMVEQDGTELWAYDDYPQLRTMSFTPRSQNWQWFSDAENITPGSALASETVSPVVAINDSLKLRVSVREISNMSQDDTRFILQYSEYADFSSAHDVVATSSCVATSTWCYADGGGEDNAILSATVLSDADACSAGAGNGCGTHNESPSLLTGFTHEAGAATEYEFTLLARAIRANAVYYFRLYDAQQNLPVPVNSGESYPSLAAEGATLVFTVSGLSAGTVVDTHVTDATSSASSVAFGSLPFGTEFEAAHQLSVETNATEGYQVLMYSDQQLQSDFGASIEPVTGTNATPTGWATGCDANAIGCFGYHTSDDLLQGGSSRFGADDSFAAFDTAPAEVMYSSIPANDSHDIVYKIKVEEEQPAGTYGTSVTYIAIPSF